MQQKQLLILFFCIFILVLGGGGVYWFLIRDDNSENNGNESSPSSIESSPSSIESSPSSIESSPSSIESSPSSIESSPSSIESNPIVIESSSSRVVSIELKIHLIDSTTNNGVEKLRIYIKGSSFTGPHDDIVNYKIVDNNDQSIDIISRDRGPALNGMYWLRIGTQVASGYAAYIVSDVSGLIEGQTYTFNKQL